MANSQIDTPIPNLSGNEIGKNDIIIAPEQQKSEQLFDEIHEKSATNPELQKLLDLIRGELISLLSGAKGQNIQDFLSNPDIFASNPSQYKNLFLVLGINLTSEKIQQLKVISPKIIKNYYQYTRKEDSRDKAVLNQDATVLNQDAIVLNQDATKKRLNRNIINEEDKGSIERIISVIPKSWNSRLDNYISTNLQNTEIFNGVKIGNSEVKLENEDDKKRYLQIIFFIDNQVAIKEEMQKSLDSLAPGEEREKIQQNINIFNKNIEVLIGLNFPRPVKSLSSEMDGNFPPTRPAETARVQAEKLEKTHDIYRDGTSLYFVDRKNPDNMKRMDIYADHVTMSIYRNGLSLSQELSMLTREETELRKDIRKAEGESQERSRETDIVGGGFFRERGKEYEKIPGSTRNTIDVLKSRPVRGVQEQYEEYEQLLATKSTEELRKESDSSKQSKGSIIGKMLELSRQLYDDNQQYFTLGTFGEEGAINEADHVKNQLDKRIQGLNVFKKSIDMSESHGAEVNKLRQGFNPGSKIDTSKLEEVARGFLGELTGDRIGLNGLSDENFQDLLSRLKQRDIAGGIWKEGVSLGQDTVSRKNQRDELSSLSQVVGGREGWQRIAKQIRIDGTLANRAFKGENGQFEKWIQSLEKPKSDTP